MSVINRAQTMLQCYMEFVCLVNSIMIILVLAMLYLLRCLSHYIIVSTVKFVKEIIYALLYLHIS